MRCLMHGLIISPTPLLPDPPYAPLSLRSYRNTALSHWCLVPQGTALFLCRPHWAFPCGAWVFWPLPAPDGSKIRSAPKSAVQPNNRDGLHSNRQLSHRVALSLWKMMRHFARIATSSLALQSVKLSSGHVLQTIAR